MKVTILMSVYNGQKFLREQIDSIRRQSIGYDKIRILIRDDGSSDGSSQVLRELQDPNIVVYQGNNIGTALSFWRLICDTELDSDYFAFSDQDDIWHANKLEKALEKLTNTDVPQLYYANVEVADKNGNGTGQLLMTEENHLSVPTIMAGLHALGCTMVFNRAAMRLYQSVTLTGIEMHDRSCFLMTYLMGKIIYDAEPRMYYRQHERNLIGNEGEKNLSYYKKRLRKTFTLWFKSEEHDATVQASDMLRNFDGQLMKEDKRYLQMIAGYRNNWKYKKALIHDSNVLYLNYRVKRSYRIRILINVF